MVLPNYAQISPAFLAACSMWSNSGESILHWSQIAFVWSSDACLTHCTRFANKTGFLLTKYVKFVDISIGKKSGTFFTRDILIPLQYLLESSLEINVKRFFSTESPDFSKKMNESWRKIWWVQWIPTARPIRKRKWTFIIYNVKCVGNSDLLLSKHSISHVRCRSASHTAQQMFGSILALGRI